MANTKSAAIIPKLQFFDSNGDPLAGGHLKTYLAGSSTPVQTFSQSDGGVLNTADIELDAAGRCTVYLSPAVSYKFVLSDALGNAVWTQDNIYEAPGIIPINYGGTQNALLKSNSTGGLVDSRLFDDGTTVYIGVPASAAGIMSISTNGQTDLTLHRSSTDGNAPVISLAKSRGTHSGYSNVVSGDKLGIITTAAYAGSLFQTANMYALVDAAVTNGQRPASSWFWLTNTNNAAPLERMKLAVGLLMLDVNGVAPTGGDKGAGTINCAGDIYKNNTAYTSPDYVFEKHFTGQIKKFKSNDGAKHYTGLKSLAKTEAYARKHLRLPNVHSSKGIFQRADVVLEKVEELYLHMFELNREVKRLNKLVKKLKG